MRILVDNKYCQIIHGGKDNLIDLDLYTELKSLLCVQINNYQHTKKYKTRDIKCNSCNYEITTDSIYNKCIVCNSMDLTCKRHWDGKVYYITKKLKFLTGFLESVLVFVKQLGYTVIIEDLRKNNLQRPDNIVTDIKVWKLRDFMIEDLKKFFSFQLDNSFYFPRGIYKAATNSGKNSFIASVYLTLNCKTLLLVHRKELFNQGVEFFTKCGIQVSKYGQGNEELGQFTIAMVRTLSNRSTKLNIKKYLKSVKCLIVDECHRASANEYKKVIKQTDAFARFFVSGTPLDSSIDKAKMDIIGQSGLIMSERTNDFLIKKGYSQKPTVVLLEYDDYDKDFDSYNEELDYIKFCKRKMVQLYNFCRTYIDMQILIAVEHIEHGNFLLERLSSLNCIVEFVHGSDKNRQDKLDRFKAKKTNILISTMIMKEGVNIHNINIGINAFGGKSVTSIKQVLGRILRNDGEFYDCLWVDFVDRGTITKKHTQKRLDLYKEEKFKIIYKKF